MAKKIQSTKKQSLNNKKLIKDILSGNKQFDEIEKKYRADKDVVLAAVEYYGHNLEFADKKLKADNDVVLAAVRQNPSCLIYADKNLRKDVKLITIAAKLGNLEIASSSIKKDKKIVLEAVKNNGSSIQFADPKLQLDKDIILAAIEQDSSSIRFCPDSIKKKFNFKHIDLKKLKQDMDQDGDFLHWDYDEKVSITRTGSEHDNEYRISVESKQDEDTSEYEIYGEFDSSLSGVKDAVECFLNNSNDLLSLIKYINIKKII